MFLVRGGRRQSKIAGLRIDFPLYSSGLFLGSDQNEKSWQSVKRFAAIDINY